LVNVIICPMKEHLQSHDLLPKSLHDIPELQKVQVREGVELRPLTTGDATQILSILETDPNIRNRVSVASKMHTQQDVAEQVQAYPNDEHTIRYGIV